MGSGLQLAHGLYKSPFVFQLYLIVWELDEKFCRLTVAHCSQKVWEVLTCMGTQRRIVISFIFADDLLRENCFAFCGICLLKECWFVTRSQVDACYYPPLKSAEEGHS